MRSTTKRTVAKARRLRRSMSPSEIALWRILRDRPEGLKFRKQHPVGPYVVDFYRASAKLAVEVDGNAHDMGDRPVRDAARDRWLKERRGLRILRIPAAELSRDVEPAILHILAACQRE